MQILGYHHSVVVLVPLLIGVALALGIFLRFIIRWLKKTVRVTVKCWCCGTVCRVVYELRNCWDCSTCEQYNGFTEDGDYNKEIPEMHDERLNYCCLETSTVASKTLPKPDVTNLSSPNGLCYQCNQNQLLKVRQLANFVPSCEDKFDEEVESYRIRLEQIYALCCRCRTFVNNELAYQSQKFGLSDLLMSTNFKRLYPKSVATFVTNASKQTLTTSKIMWKNKRRSVGTLSALSLLISVTVIAVLWLSDLHNIQCDSQTELVVLNNFLPLHFINVLPKIFIRAHLACLFGLFLQLASILLCKASRLLLDYVAVLFWLLVLTLHSLDYVKWTTMFGGKEDLFVLQFCSSTFLSLNVCWLLVLPRRRVRRTKRGRKSPNRSACSDSAWSQRSSPYSSVINSSPNGMDASKNCFKQQQQLTSLETSYSSCENSNSFKMRPDLPDLFSSSLVRNRREGSPSRQLGAKLSTLSLQCRSVPLNGIRNGYPTPAHGPSLLKTSTSNFLETSSSPSVNTSYRFTKTKPNTNTILAPAKFTVMSQQHSPVPSSVGLWSKSTNHPQSDVGQFWWTTSSNNGVRNGDYSSSMTSPTAALLANGKSNNNGRDDDTVSLLSGYSCATTSRRIAQSGDVCSSAPNSRTTTPIVSSAKSTTENFWKIVVGVIMAFSLSTNFAVLYHIFMKK